MPSSMGDITAMANGMAGPGPGYAMQQHQQALSYQSMMDRCVGCGAVDVPLLACDDLDNASKNKDGLPVITDPSQRARFCANCMIGKKVRVFWPVDNSWYIGTVQQFNAATGEHLLKYEDDDTEWVHIGESNTTINPSEFNHQHSHQTQFGAVQQQTNGFEKNPETGASSTDSKSPAGSGKAVTDGNDLPASNSNRASEANSGGEPSSSPTAPSGSAPTNQLDSQSNAAATGPGPEPSSSVPQSAYRLFGALPPQGSGYPPPPGLGQHHLPPHLAHHHSHHPPHGYSHGPGGPPPTASSMYGGPNGYPSSSHGRGLPPPLGYGYPGHPSMAMPQRHGPIPNGPPHHYGGIHGHPHRIEGPPPLAGAAGSGNSASGNGKKKTGPKAWTKDEDALLLSIVQSMRIPMKWSLVAQSLPERTGKQCRERYVNHLNPRLKVTDWSPMEDATIFHLYNTIGSHWAKMSKIIPGRTDNGIKNRYALICQSDTRKKSVPSILPSCADIFILHLF